MTDDLLAQALAARLLDRAAAIWSDSTIPPSAKLDALGDAARDLVEPASGCRQLMPALMQETSDEAITARAAARRAEAQKRAAAQAERERQVSAVIERDAAEAERKAAEQALREAEQVLTIYSVPGAPTREKALARGAVKLAREELAAAEERLEKVSNQTPEVKP